MTVMKIKNKRQNQLNLKATHLDNKINYQEKIKIDVDILKKDQKELIKKQ